MHIVIVNDDGVHAGGIVALSRELSRHYDVTVIAPDRERSAASHSITLDRPLTVREVIRPDMPGVTFFAVNGTPVDCVHMARALMPNTDLVISGINNGANLGGDISYSGTVHAALESCTYGIPAIALSLRILPDMQHLDEEGRFETAARLSKQIIARLPMQVLKNAVLNINYPANVVACPPQIKVCPQGVSVYRSFFQKNTDPFGREVFWLYAEDDASGYNEIHHTDVYWSDLGFVTCTPVTWNVSADSLMSETECELHKIRLQPD